MVSPPYTAYCILLLLICSIVYFLRLAWPISWLSRTPRRSIDLLTATAEDLQQLLKAASSRALNWLIDASLRLIGMTIILGPSAEKPTSQDSGGHPGP
ncbi:hypothetical protein GGI35DRAFT_433918 [Trichoderma velutinum]